MDTLALRLIEHVPRAVRLPREDVDYLFAKARSSVEIIPTRERHRYRLTARGVAGVMLTPNRRIVIRPKIPSANLFHLLDPDAPPSFTADQSAAEPGMDAIDFLGRRLAAGMHERAAHGLTRDYIEHADQQPFLQGRLDVAAQVRETPAKRDRFHVTRQEFSADSLVNRLPKATAEGLLASPFISAATRSCLRAALAGYDAVTSIPLDTQSFDLLVFDSRTEAERPFLQLCRLIVESLVPIDRGGEVASPSFLLNLETAFERYIERGLRRHFPDIESQQEFCYHAPVVDGQPRLVGRPDFAIRVGGKLTSVLDAKWKLLDGPPPAGDVHQALAYAVGLGCGDVRLIYPGRRWSTCRYSLVQSHVSLTIHTLRVVGSREKCEQSMLQLVRAVD